MKFSHLADCHIGSWREDKLKELNTEAFFRAIDISIKKEVDFILISGDLFNNAIPPINNIKDVVKKFRELKEKNIGVYLIAGSHDYSPSGKTMLEVLEEAGLCINVVKGTIENKKLKLKFTIDKKTGAKITGMLGRRGQLEKSYYEELDLEYLEKEQGFKIFMFHSAITELKPKSMEKMDSFGISYLPKNFDYYAGGHVHIIEKIDLEGYKNIVYPGPLFPNNFHELEELKGGGFYIYDNGSLIRETINIKNVFSIMVNAENKTPELITNEILDKLKGKEFYNTLVLIRVFGTLESGKTTDIDWKKIYSFLESAYFVMKNTNGLTTKEYEEIKIEHTNTEEVESNLIEQQPIFKNLTKEKQTKLIKNMMHILSNEKKDGEKVYQYEARLKEEMDKLIDS
ncbi:MAG: exonuclease SbcCD subunit D [Candidatus Woesearchaeota archaeon]